MPYKIWLILFSYLSSTIDTISLFRHSVTLANAVERQTNTHISYTNTYIGHSTLLNSSYTTVTLYSYTLFIVLHTLNPHMLYIIIFYKIDVCLYEFPGLRKSTKSFSGCSIIFFQNIMQSYRAFPCNLSVHRFHDMFLYCREVSYIHKSRTIPWHHFRANDTNVIKTGPMMD